MFDGKTFSIILSNYWRFFLRSKKSRLYITLTFIPAVIVIFFKIFSGTSASSESFWPQVVVSLYFGVIIPITALLNATSVLGDEVEERTLLYIQTAPLSLKTFLLAKFVAYFLFLLLTILASILCSALIFFFRQFLQITFWRMLFELSSAAFFALLAYGGLFLFFSVLNPRRAVIKGFVFIFVWEYVVQFMPGFTQRLTIAHFAKSMLPYSSAQNEEGIRAFLFYALEPTPAWKAAVILSIIFMVLIFLSVNLFSRKEYILSTDNE